MNLFDYVHADAILYQSISRMDIGLVCSFVCMGLRHQHVALVDALHELFFTFASSVNFG